MTVDTLQLSQEFVAGPARIRFDVLGSEPVGEALADKDFLDYRLADVEIAPEPTLDRPGSAATGRPARSRRSS